MRDSATVVVGRDTTMKGWRAEYAITSDQGTTVCYGVVRTGEFTTAPDTEILATAEIIQKAPSTTAIHTSTKGPREALKEATTSLDQADVIREAVKAGKARVTYQPDAALQEKNKESVREMQPEPIRYTSQAYVQSWMAQRKDEREQEQLKGLPDSYKGLGIGPRTKRLSRPDTEKWPVKSYNTERGTATSTRTTRDST